MTVITPQSLVLPSLKGGVFVGLRLFLLQPVSGADRQHVANHGQSTPGRDKGHVHPGDNRHRADDKKDQQQLVGNPVLVGVRQALRNQPSLEATNRPLVIQDSVPFKVVARANSAPPITKNR